MLLTKLILLGLWVLLRKSIRALLLVGITALLVWMQQNDPGQYYSSWQNQIWNTYQRWGVNVTDHKPSTLVVQIDLDSINRVQTLYGEEWPWSRQRFAALLKILFEDYQVSVVGVDMIMPDLRDAKGNVELLNLSNQYPVVFSEAFDLSSSRDALITGYLAGGIPVENIDGNTHPFPQANGYIGLTEQLTNAPCVGHVTPIKDMATGGLVTKVAPLVTYEGKVYPMLVLEMLRCQTNGQYQFAVTSHENGWLFEARNLMGEGSTIRLVVDDAGLWRVPFQITNADIVAITAIDVLQHNIPTEYAEALRNSMVILGGTAPVLGDQYPTPLSTSNVSGVSLHVQMLEWLLSGQDNSPSFSLDYWAWIAGFCGLVILYLLRMFGAGIGITVLSLLLMAFAWLVVGFWIWTSKQWFVPMHPIILFIVFLAIFTPLEWLLAQFTAGRLHKLFQDSQLLHLISYTFCDSHNELLYQGKSRRCLPLLSLGGVLAGIGSGFLLLDHARLPAWIVFALALLLMLVAWWQTRCVKAEFPIGANPAGNFSGRVEAGKSPISQSPNCGWKYWRVRLGLFVLTVLLGIVGKISWWWIQDDKPLWRLGFIPLPEMVEIPPSKFQMGGKDSYEAQPIHTVTIRQPFRISRHEITFAEYDYYVWLMQQNAIYVELPDDEGWGRNSRPVINVSWEDAQRYVSWLSKETKTSCRLPTEAEWEYAARADTKTDYFWGDGIGQNNANCCNRQPDNKATSPVGSFKANAWGLQDTHGNLWEWVQDCWHENYQGAPPNSVAWEADGDCDRRVLRGGSWADPPTFLRSSSRNYGSSADRVNFVGFRVVCDFPFVNHHDIGY